MKVYVSTSNQYLHLIKIYAHLFNKFWNRPGQEVVVLGYDKPTFELPKNFSFVSMGEQVGGIRAWSTGLRKFFKSIDDEFFIWAEEDMFLTTYVNFNTFDNLVLLLNDNIGRIALTNDALTKSNTAYKNNKNVIVRNQDVQYRLSVVSSIWNRIYLLKYLQPNLSPWEFEIEGSNLAKNDKYYILGNNKDFAIYLCCAVRRGKINKPLNFRCINEISKRLDKESIEELRERGFIDEKNIVNK